MKKLVCVSAIAACAGASSAQVIWTTGDLGTNVIDGGVDYSVFPDLDMPDNSLASTLTVKYGLWNSPDVPVDVLLNGNFVGSFVADQGYISPGPSFIDFDVTGLLLDGNNEVLFSSTGPGQYVVGQVDLTYFQIPAPASAALLGLGALAATRRRR